MPPSAIFNVTLPVLKSHIIKPSVLVALNKIHQPGQVNPKLIEGKWQAPGFNQGESIMIVHSLQISNFHDKLSSTLFTRSFYQIPHHFPAG